MKDRNTKNKIIAYAQIGNPEEKRIKNTITQKFSHTWLPDKVVLISSSAVLSVVAPIKFEETEYDSDGVRVTSEFEVLTGGVFDLTF